MHPTTTLLCSLLLFGLAQQSAAAAKPITSTQAPYPTTGRIERLDPALDRLLDPEAKLEVLAEGFTWSEGPLWLPSDKALLFSDTREDTVYRWSDDKGVTVFLTPSGFTGDFYDGNERGSNGLTLDATGQLLLAQHGNRQIARLAEDGRSFVTVADRYEGKRFNSPNDLCLDRAGRIYFTDPPYGLGKTAKREIDFSGVYRRNEDGSVVLITRELERPNGIALSQDQRTLYIANSHSPRPIIAAMDIRDDGTMGPLRVFFDTAPLVAKGGRGSPDGLKVDTAGNLWATGPGGVLIIDPSGKHLGTIHTGQPTANCAFGEEDAGTLYITANSKLCRIRTKTQGSARPRAGGGL